MTRERSNERNVWCLYTVALRLLVLVLVLGVYAQTSHSASAIPNVRAEVSKARMLELPPAKADADAVLDLLSHEHCDCHQTNGREEDRNPVTRRSKIITYTVVANAPMSIKPDQPLEPPRA